MPLYLRFNSFNVESSAIKILMLTGFENVNLPRATVAMFLSHVLVTLRLKGGSISMSTFGVDDGCN